MNRRAFIFKTALVAMAAPFLPVASGSTQRKLPRKHSIWRCRWSNGPHRVHVMESDDIRDMHAFINDYEHIFGRLTIWLNGEIFYNRPKILINQH
jgi:hypothetical protein